MDETDINSLNTLFKILLLAVGVAGIVISVSILTTLGEINNRLREISHTVIKAYHHGAHRESGTRDEGEALALSGGRASEE